MKYDTTIVSPNFMPNPLLPFQERDRLSLTKVDTIVNPLGKGNFELGLTVKPKAGYVKA